eukprot:g11462.t1
MRHRGPDGLNKGRWSKTEHEIFLQGLRNFGKNWEVISGLLKTRSVLQVRTHAQKYFHNVERGLPFPENPYDDGSQEEAEGGGGGGDDDDENNHDDEEAKATQDSEGEDQAAAGRCHPSGRGAAAAGAAVGANTHPPDHPTPQYPPHAHAGAPSPFYLPFSGPPTPHTFSRRGGDLHTSAPASAAAGATTAPAFGGDAAFPPWSGYGAPVALPYREQQQQQQQHYDPPRYHQQRQLQSLPSWVAGSNAGGWGGGAMPVPMGMPVEGDRPPPPGDWPDDLNHALLLAANSAMDGELNTGGGSASDNFAVGGGSGFTHVSGHRSSPNLSRNPLSGGGGAGRVAWQGYNHVPISSGPGVPGVGNVSWPGYNPAPAPDPAPNPNPNPNPGSEMR